MRNKPNFHTGNRIKEIIKEQGIPVKKFALKIRRSRTVVYNIFTRKSIDTGLLINICKVLNHNLLGEIIDAHSSENWANNKTTEIDSLKNEIAYLKEINVLLRKQ